MAHRGFLRFRDRASYKTSDVFALFLIGLFLGGIFCGLCVLVDYVARLVLGPYS